MYMSHTGLYQTYYNSNTKNLKSSVMMIKDKKEGQYLEYYDITGVIKIMCDYVNDQIHGEYYEYHKDGSIYITGYYINGLKNGEFKTYVRGLKYLTNYVDGKKEGPCIEYYYSDNGILDEHTIYNYKNNLRHGLCGMYAPGKKIIEETIYVNGEPHGECKSYWPNGNLSSTSFYQNGLLEGEQLEYHDNGIIKSKCTYLHGQKHGEDFIYLKNANLYLIHNYINGKIQPDKTIVNRDA
jgi:antitoxin component YwqK of YwqJK toxin-antitoxin module